MFRNERFPATFQEHLQSLMQLYSGHVIQRHRFIHYYYVLHHNMLH